MHAARKFLSNIDPEHAIVKLDFSNAFNSIRRDSMLEAIRSHAPSIYPLVHIAYSAPSVFCWGDRTISSAEGV